MDKKIKKFFSEFILIFFITLIVSAGVIYLFEGAFNWRLSFTLAIGIGIAIPLSHALRGKE